MLVDTCLKLRLEVFTENLLNVKTASWCLNIHHSSQWSSNIQRSNNEKNTFEFFSFKLPISDNYSEDKTLDSLHRLIETLKHYSFVLNSPVPTGSTPTSEKLAWETNNSCHVCRNGEMRHLEQDLLRRACKHVKPVARLWLAPEFVFTQASANGTLVY